MIQFSGGRLDAFVDVADDRDCELAHCFHLADCRYAIEVRVRLAEMRAERGELLLLFPQADTQRAQHSQSGVRRASH